MRERIFKSLMVVAGISIFIGFFLIVFVLYNYFDKQLYIQLEKSAGYLSTVVEMQGIEYLESMDEEQRITLIDQSGKVLFDNQANINLMDNHLDREEVQEAIETGKGSSERYSKTMSTKTTYVSLLLNNGMILRVASDLNTVFYLIYALGQPISIIILIVFCLALYTSKRVSDKIMKPVNEIDLDNPKSNDIYSEFRPLLTRMMRQKQKIAEQMELAVQQQNEFKMITDHMREGFVVVSKELMILSCNESIKRHLDIEEDIINKSIYILNHNKEFIKFVERTMEGYHDEWLQEVNDCYYQWISNPVFDDNQLTGAVIIMIDVSESKKRERYRQEFTANVSHELKTPLTSISGFAEIIQNGIVKDEDVKSFAGDIYNESQRLIQLVNDIIHLSRLDDHSVIYESETISVKEKIETCLTSMKYVADKHGIELNMHGKDMEIEMIPTLFEEILYNLISNAIRYNKENGRVDVYFNKENNMFILKVKDSGIGISKVDQEHIFERFYRVDKSRSKMEGGTGLGLSIVKHAVLVLAGKIEVDSIVDEGTTITVYLPI